MVRIGHAQTIARHPGRGDDGVVREHHPFRLAGCPARGHHEGVAVVDRAATGERVFLAVGIDDARRRHGIEQRCPRGGRKPLIDREGSIAAIPHPPQGDHEPRPAWQVEGDDARRHIGGANAAPGCQRMLTAP